MANYQNQQGQFLNMSKNSFIGGGTNNSKSSISGTTGTNMLLKNESIQNFNKNNNIDKANCIGSSVHNVSTIKPGIKKNVEKVDKATNTSKVISLEGSIDSSDDERNGRKFITIDESIVNDGLSTEDQSGNA